jgi:hypothetical protein
MTETSSKLAAPADAPRLVFLGLPDSGKSALLGALAQAAQTQEKLLGSRLHAQDLEQLQKYAYDKAPEPDQPDLAEFTATLDPMDNQPGPKGGAVFLDCDGEVAADFLGKPEELAARQGLGKEISATDAVVLVVDSADVSQLRQSVNLFNQFLKQLEVKRTKGVEVTGLPVYLVLTKCDRLAKSTDTATAWMNRVEERKGQVEKFFKDYLSRNLPEDKKAFGKIDLHLWATSIGRPGFTDVPANPLEPYGVAELFRQCIQSARTFHQRRRKSSHRLEASVAGAAALVAFLALLAGVFIATQPDAEQAQLESDLQTIMPGKDDGPAVRFKEPLDDKIQKLDEITARSVFAKLPEARQADVKKYLKEVKAYRDFDRDLLTKVPEPRFAASDLDLEKINEELGNLQPLADGYLDLERVDQGMLKVNDRLKTSKAPEKLDADKVARSLRVILAKENYYSSWLETKALRRYAQYRHDWRVFERTVQDAVAWYAEQGKEGRELQLSADRLVVRLGEYNAAADKKDTIKKKLVQDIEDWQAAYEKYVDRPNKYRENDAHEDISVQRLPGSLTLTYGMVANLTSGRREPNILSTHSEWRKAKENLEKANSKLLEKQKEVLEKK